MAETFEALKQKYANEWLAVRVTKRENFDPVEGELLARGKTSAEVHRAILRRPELIAVFFTGKGIPDDVVIAL